MLIRWSWGKGRPLLVSFNRPNFEPRYCHHTHFRYLLFTQPVSLSSLITITNFIIPRVWFRCVYKKMFYHYNCNVFLWLIASICSEDISCTCYYWKDTIHCQQQIVILKFYSSMIRRLINRVIDALTRQDNNNDVDYIGDGKYQ